MQWEVEYTDEFKEWWDMLAEKVQEDIAAVVGLLEVRDVEINNLPISHPIFRPSSIN